VSFFATDSVRRSLETPAGFVELGESSPESPAARSTTPPMTAATKRSNPRPANRRPHS
jgi:hypothetical protein